MRSTVTPLSELLIRWEEIRQSGGTISAEELCKDRPDLLEEARERIAVLEGIQALARGTAPESPSPAGPPDVPGYELRGPLGRGGMGIVYKARDLRLGRTVALKLLPLGETPDPLQLARFQVEAEALASLSHPNIVQIHEVGRRPCPYLALEYVEGGSLDSALHAGPMPPRDAAALLRPLALAIETAHRRGILHRDLKPANVLLAADGTPKVTDFGLARQLDGETRLTASGAVFGTPSYMAPEQARGEPRAVGPAADIWGLGAVLYEMLTGRPPFEGETPFETIMQVIEQEPAPPRSLDKAIPRDLETICLKCLRKEPGKRYATAGELADDLGRFLSGEPVAARPVGPLERAARWTRRHPALAGVLSALAVVIVASVAGLWALYARAEKRRADAEQAEETARQNETKATRSARLTRVMSEFLLRDMIAAAAPKGIGVGKDVTLRAALDLAEKQAAAAFQGEPEVEAAVRYALGRAYFLLGDMKTALPQLTRSLELFRTEDPGSQGMLECLACHAAVLQQVKQLPQAEAGFREALAGYRALLGDGDEETINTILSLASVLQTRGKLDEAEPLLEEGSRLALAGLGEKHPTTLRLRGGLGMLLRLRGKFVEAARVMSEVAGVFLQMHGPKHLDYCIWVAHHSESLLRSGKAADAVAALTPNLKTCQEQLDEGHPLILLTQLYLGEALTVAGEPARAEPVLAQAEKGYAAMLPPGDPTLARIRMLRGLALVGQKKWADAEKVLLPAHAALAKAGDVEGARRAAREGLVPLYKAQGNTEAASMWEAKGR